MSVSVLRVEVGGCDQDMISLDLRIGPIKVNSRVYILELQL